MSPAAARAASPSGTPEKGPKIAVIGAGIVGVPMAALLAGSFGGNPDSGRVVLIQRFSPASGWKIAALNAGRNPLGGVEPELEGMVARAAAAGTLRASPQMGEAGDADAVLVCVQTDRNGLAPDYGPLFGALDALAAVLRRNPPGPPPLVVIESTLAPTTMATVIEPRLAGLGLHDRKDIRLGYSPNRVMPGRLVERIRDSDKIISGLRPETAEDIRRLYSRIVLRGRLHTAGVLTAEIVKTLENAARDVRIAFATEIGRLCDDADIDFHALRALVNAGLERQDRASADPTAVPTGGLLVPTCGVGGHCLPKDGFLLLWRMNEAGGASPGSVILEARRINDASPAETAARMEKRLGPLYATSVALLGAAYRPGAADTRNSPALALGRILADRCRAISIHDPYVRPDDPRLAGQGLDAVFTNDLGPALSEAEIVVVGTAHPYYREVSIGEGVGLSARALFDAAHLFRRDEFDVRPLVYEGVGKGRREPPRELVEFAAASFRAVERGLANEVDRLIGFLNAGCARAEAQRVDLQTVRNLASTCATGCLLAEPGPVGRIPEFGGFQSGLALAAARGEREGS